MSPASAARRNAPLQIEYFPPGALKPRDGTARLHPASQIKRLCQSIEAFGFNVPVLVDGEERLVAGHARLADRKSVV